jgi:hypothetical protein
MLHKTQLTYTIALLISIAYGFSLSLINIGSQVFLTLIFSGYIILGIFFGFVFRKDISRSLITAFTLTFFGWIVAVALFWSLDGVTALIQAFSQGLQNVLMAGFLFGFTTILGTFLSVLVLRLLEFISKRRKSLAPV